MVNDRKKHKEESRTATGAYNRGDSPSYSLRTTIASTERRPQTDQRGATSRTLGPSEGHGAASPSSSRPPAERDSLSPQRDQHRFQHEGSSTIGPSKGHGEAFPDYSNRPSKGAVSPQHGRRHSDSARAPSSTLGPSEGYGAASGYSRPPDETGSMSPQHGRHSPRAASSTLGPSEVYRESSLHQSLPPPVRERPTGVGAEVISVEKQSREREWYRKGRAEILGAEGGEPGETPTSFRTKVKGERKEKVEEEEEEEEKEVAEEKKEEEEEEKEVAEEKKEESTDGKEEKVEERKEEEGDEEDGVPQVDVECERQSVPGVETQTDEVADTQAEATIVQFFEDEDKDFKKDEHVFALVDNKTRCLAGKINWTGRHFAIYGSRLAVVELEEAFAGASSGRFLGQTLTHTKKKRALMIETSLLIKREHIHYCKRYELIGKENSMEKTPRKATAWRMRGKHLTIEIDRAPDTLDNNLPPNIKEVSILEVRPLPSYLGEPRSLPVPCVAPSRLPLLVGEHRGIQGESNSCYLDTTLFTFFAFSSYWERQLELHCTNDRARALLTNHIIYPLRADCFVPARNMVEVRRLLCQATNRGEFLNQSRDLPETFNALLDKTLGLPPMVMTSSLGRNGKSFPASYSIETMPPNEQPSICTSQHYLESSAIAMEFQLTAVPECLILLLPREKGYYMKEVIPSLELDLEPIMEGGSKFCYICGQVADTQCPQRMIKCSAASTFFCSDCLEQEAQMGRKEGQRIPLNPTDKRKTSRLVLNSVICISHSHYNCFSRCGNQWVFFDSMNDREVFNTDNICVPNVRRVPLNDWIRKRLVGGQISQGDRGIYDRAFSCPYALIYGIPDV